MATRRPGINVRRAELRDAEAMQATIASPRGAGRHAADAVAVGRNVAQAAVRTAQPNDYLLVAEVDGEVVGNARAAR